MQKLIFKSGDSTNNKTPISQMVDKNSRISQVKEGLSKKINVNSSKIVLRYKGHILPDTDTVSKCKISSLGLITYNVLDSEQSLSEESSDDYVTITLINGPGNPIKVQKDLSINEARTFIAKVLNLPVSTIVYCNNENQKSLSLLSTKTPIDIEDFIQTINNNKNEDESNEYYDDSEYDDSKSNQLIGDLPLNDDGSIHFVYQYKLLSFPVYLPNNLIAKSRCRDFATVDTVKDILAKRINEEPESTVLTYNGEILANDMKIRDINFVTDGVFRLEYYTPKPPVRKIFIKISSSPVKPAKNGKLSRKTQTFPNDNGNDDDVLCAQAHFNEKATIGKAKEKLADFLNCDPESISLIFNDPSIQVNDNSLLKDLNIESNAIIDAEIDDGDIINGINNSPKRRSNKQIRNISIKLSNGLVAKGRFNNKATVKTMKHVIAYALNTTTDCLTVINYDENMKEEDFENIRIKDLLDAKYSRNSGMNQADSDNEYEEEEKNDNENDSETESLSVEVGDERLTPVTFLLEEGQKVNAQFKPSVTIGRAKEVLSKTLNVDPDRIIFKFKSKDGNEFDEADDDQLLKNMSIGKDGLVVTKISSFPKSPKAKRNELNTKDNEDDEAEYNNYSDDNQNMIHENLEGEVIYEENKIEIEEEEEDVSYEDNEEAGGLIKATTNNEYSEVKVSLFDEDEAPIQRNKNARNVSGVNSSSRPLVFQTGSGKVAKTRFKETATVGKLKDKMAEALDINPGNMSLSFGSKDINDNSLLKDVVNDAECNTSQKLVLKQSPTKLKVVKPLVLRLEDGREIRSRFRIISTIGKIKETLGEIIKTDPSTLVFYYGDETLTDDLFLSEINILDNECIYVSKE